MPCRYEESPQEIAAAKTTHRRLLVKPYVEKLDKLTRLLCWIMTQREGISIETRPGWFEEVISQNKELMNWWRAHQEEDAARIARELSTARNKALAKLSAADKKALGL